MWGYLHHSKPGRRFHCRSDAHSLALPEGERSLDQAKPDSGALATYAEFLGLESPFIEFAEMVAECEFKLVQYQAAMKIAIERKSELERTLVKERGVVALVEGLGHSQIIAQKWKSLNLDR